MIRPLNNNIIVKKQTDKTEGGFVVPLGEEELSRGEIIGVGKNCSDEIKVGDTIVYAKFAENEIGGFLLINENDILGVYETDKN